VATMAASELTGRHDGRAVGKDDALPPPATGAQEGTLGC
jgi:hypothetical protein